MEQDHRLLLCRHQAPVGERIIMLNGKGHRAGPVNNVAVMTQFRPPMRAGRTPVVASVVGEAPQENAALMRLDDRVRAHMRKWFGPVVDSWKMLRAYPLAQALPQQRHAEWEQSPVRVGGSGGVYMCGDYRETPSIREGGLQKTRWGGRDPRPGGRVDGSFDAGDQVCGRSRSSRRSRQDTPQ